MALISVVCPTPSRSPVVVVLRNSPQLFLMSKVATCDTKVRVPQDCAVANGNCGKGVNVDFNRNEIRSSISVNLGRPAFEMGQSFFFLSFFP